MQRETTVDDTRRVSVQVPESQVEADVWRDGEWFVARARGVEVASQGKTRRRFASIERVALRKLIQMNRAALLSDLRVPPGNRLKALGGRLAGFHSIRIDDQWRIVFRWTDSGPEQVAIDDYHQ